MTIGLLKFRSHGGPIVRRELEAFRCDDGQSWLFSTTKANDGKERDGIMPPHSRKEIQVTVNGDSATARAYVIASRTFERTVLSENARAGGWYDPTLARTAEGWRFKSIALSFIWNTREVIRGGPPGGGMPSGKSA